MTTNETILLQNLEFIFQDKALLEQMKGNNGIIIGSALKKKVLEIVQAGIETTSILPVANDCIITFDLDVSTALLTVRFTAPVTNKVLLTLSGYSMKDILAKIIPSAFLGE